MKNVMKILAGATAATAFSTLGFASQAEAVILSLEFEEDTSFNDGGNFSGTFKYDTEDDTDNRYFDWNILSEGGEDLTRDFTYTESSSETPSDDLDSGFIPRNQQFSLNARSASLTDERDRDLTLVFNDSLDTLTTLGSSTSINTGESREENDTGGGGQFRTPEGGIVTVTNIDDPNDPQAVPFEAESGIAFTLLGLGAAWKFRRQIKAKLQH
ncbi:MAG: hypothetical protein ACOC04_06345 [Halothece sp.]